MLHAILLAAVVVPCHAARTQSQLDDCWAARAAQARTALDGVYPRAKAAVRKLDVDPKLLAAAQSAWNDARKATCAFEVSLVAGGSIAPMVRSTCDDRITRARTARLEALVAAAATAKPLPPLKPIAPATDAELNRLYGSLAERIEPVQQTALTASDVAWIAYRDRACKLEGGDCLTQMERERIAELKAGWSGEPFW
ncbi:MAG TPA: lysozyme inhibitor LprI family protein [Candidatus Tumulicola sp.]|jgi:uncharacterized protein YecT (DUF1311 family)